MGNPYETERVEAEFGGGPGLDAGAREAGYDEMSPMPSQVHEHQGAFWTDPTDPESVPDATLVGNRKPYRTWPEQNQ